MRNVRAPNLGARAGRLRRREARKAFPDCSIRAKHRDLKNARGTENPMPEAGKPSGSSITWAESRASWLDISQARDEETLTIISLTGAVRNPTIAAKLGLAGSAGADIFG
jgi:hypothetical protein